MLIADEGLREKRFWESPSPAIELDRAIEEALQKIDLSLRTFGHGFLSPMTEGNRYQASNNTGWTSGFWTGILWLAYELTGKADYRLAAEAHVESFAERLANNVELNHHDIGFLYTPSCVAAYKLTGNELAKETAMKAAEHLMMTRYENGAGIFRCWSWGKYAEPPYNGNVIIDSLMNMPLLAWASEIAEKPSLREAAFRHIEKVTANSVRANASTYHVFYFDPSSGLPMYGETAQGYSDESCWARGQSWGVYGSVLNYSYFRDQRLLDISRKLANYFLNRTPEDMIAYWDFDFKDGSGAYKDSSASAVTACGLLELVKWLDNEEEKRYYVNAALHIVKQLHERYTSREQEDSSALLLHGVGSVPHQSGVDEASLFGDYFYMEALVRLKKNWSPYW
ncbi:glycoside hydrolase family 88 protein [Paenibacillus contaminans]|uniref:Glucuronyl hydrolase n=1 Tax=Paenibacillus contaminans TaxID=450362 RepID=A0A329MT23_9BACL|nr:glycoside hydrolase family 88 protein [Paenibacillus contaminans]RAV23091.1 glucuronyl hydrolase [Paenibacillus contaminans]